ncbi:MAG TPA: penicillin-binding protein 1A [Stellaceae bacterium]|nr:penicillin-binding protein 1A [Stellaceae bacterium]
MRYLRFLRHIRILLTGLVATALFGTLAVWLVYEHYSQDLPGFQQLVDYQPPTVTRVEAGDGRLLAEYAKEKRIFVPIAAMPPLLVNAVIAAEDREFYQHGGVDPEAIVRAGLRDIFKVGSGRRGEGASTITMQVVKNFLLSNEYKLSRKIKETILAVRIERALSKDRILELYMNQVYVGWGAYGVAAGAQNYFNKSVDDLTIAEAAFLAGTLKGPENYDPTKHPEAALTRRNYVIDGMEKIGAITADQARAAEAEPIVTRKRDETEIYSAPYFTEDVRRELVQRFGEQALYEGGLSVRTSIDPSLQSIAHSSLHDGLIAYDRRHGWRGPIGHIEVNDDWATRLDSVPAPPGAAPWREAVVLQVKPEAAEIGLVGGVTGTIPMSELAWARPTLDDQKVGSPPRAAGDVVKRGDLVLVEPLPPPAKPAKGQAGPLYALRQIPNVSGAIVALDPHTGRILAMDGGWSYEMSQFNRATQARRQIGSTMKPFVYLAALDNGMTPSTLILDLPVAIDQGPGLPLWQPRNFEGEEVGGPRTVRWAIEHSINTMTVRMASTIGIDKIAPYVERLGIMDHMPLEYSMVLGAGDTTPVRLTTAYAMLVNGGKRITPSLIDRVQDRDGKTVFKQDTRACARCGDYDWPSSGGVPPLPDTRKQVLDPGTAYQMVDILEGVVQRGTGAAVGAALHFPLAGKTGTTNGPNDTWFEGFSPDLAVGIYVGFDDPRTLGPHEQGASVAAPIFTEFMGAALKDKPPVDFRIPPDIRLVRVNADSGQLAMPGDRNVIWEAFKPGTEPSPDENESVVEGGPGTETISSDGGMEDAIPATPAYGVGVLVPPTPRSTQAPNQPRPVVPPSTDGTGLY